MHNESFEAAKRGDADELVKLLDNGADVHMTNEKGQTLLHIAVALDNHDVAKLLLERGVDANAKDEGGQTPMHLVASGFASSGLGELLVQHGAVAGFANKAGLTASEVARHTSSSIGIEQRRDALRSKPITATETHLQSIETPDTRQR